MGPKSIRFLPHPADLRVRVRAKDAAGLFRALAAAMPRVLDADATGPRRGVSFTKEAATREELLVAFLNELLFLGEARGLVCVSARAGISREGGAWRGRFTAYCRRRSRQGREVKAATHHGLALVRGRVGLKCDIIFDL